MQYCTRCVYPANAKPGIVFDEKGSMRKFGTFE